MTERLASRHSRIRRKGMTPREMGWKLGQLTATKRFTVRETIGTWVRAAFIIGRAQGNETDAELLFAGIAETTTDPELAETAKEISEKF